MTTPIHEPWGTNPVGDSLSPPASEQDDEAARALIAAIRERGDQVRLRNGAPFLSGPAFRRLSDDERRVWRDSYDAFRRALLAEADTPKSTAAAAVQPTTASEPEIPPHRKAIIDWHTPEERTKRDEEATETMHRTAGKRSPLL